jgi:hypothetical protein
MGRYLKNTQITSGSYAVQLPLGSNSLGPDAPVDGQVRFNQDTHKIELYYNGSYQQVAKIGSVNIAKDSFITANATTYYGPMTYSYSAGQEANVMVFVGGVHQVPGANYTFVGNTSIALTPSVGGYDQPITVLHNFNSTDAA